MKCFYSRNFRCDEGIDRLIRIHSGSFDSDSHFIRCALVHFDRYLRGLGCRGRP